MKDIHKSMSTNRKKDIENIFNEMFAESANFFNKLTVKNEVKTWKK